MGRPTEICRMDEQRPQNRPDVLRERDLPELTAGAEWVADKSFKAGEELLRIQL